MAIRDVVDLLSCPHCGGSLTLTEAGGPVLCPKGHAFDLARQGYLNLLSAPRPKNADSVAMVAARDRFLSEGHYQMIADRLVRLAVQHETAGHRQVRILDAGAGTGYYLLRLLDALPMARGIALDISVAACRRSARAPARVGAVVADTWQGVPVRNDTADLLLSVFAPRNAAEFRRTIAPTGMLVTVSPAPEHLREIREPLGLLQIEQSKRERLEASLAAGFFAASQETLRFKATWRTETLHDLVAMGPNAFHLSDSDIADRLGSVSDPSTVTVAVDISVWSPRP